MKIYKLVCTKALHRKRDKKALLKIYKELSTGEVVSVLHRNIYVDLFCDMDNRRYNCLLNYVNINRND